MKVILRITGGITSKTIDIPERLVMTEFKVPLRPKMSLVSMIKEPMQEMITPETTQNKALIFRWNRKDKWGGKLPIMDLEDYY